MPQLDSLIILTQFKVFVILFIIAYFYFLFFSLSGLNKNFVVRKYKINNTLKLLEMLKSYRFFFFYKLKSNFVMFFDNTRLNLLKFIQIELNSQNKFFNFFFKK